jgi:hypothetical protein
MVQVTGGMDLDGAGARGPNDRRGSVMQRRVIDASQIEDSAQAQTERLEATPVVERGSTLVTVFIPASTTTFGTDVSLEGSSTFRSDVSLERSTTFST